MTEHSFEPTHDVRPNPGRWRLYWREPRSATDGAVTLQNICLTPARDSCYDSHVVTQLALSGFGRKKGSEALVEIATRHEVRRGDARDLSWVPSTSVHLICTSPPYGPLKSYPDVPGQLGNIQRYDSFMDELERFLHEALRVLVPGGRIACVVGDVCISRRKGGRHYVLPLSSDI